MREIIQREMKRQRFNCSSLAKEAGLSRHNVLKIVKELKEAKISEAVAIVETLNLKVNSVKDLKDIFLS
jgi:DNA-binding phage protein